LNETNIILALDPSSSVCGYAVATFNEKLLDAGMIRPSPKLVSAMLRMDQIILDVIDLANEVKPDVILIEMPGGKVHGRIKGKGHGLSTYGVACGRIYEAIARTLPESYLLPVLESEWTANTPKAKRAQIVAMKWRQINVDADRGLDACDAAGLLLWFLNKHKVANLTA